MKELNRIVEVLNARAGKWWFDDLPMWTGGPGPDGKLTVKARMIDDGKEVPVFIEWNRSKGYTARVLRAVDKYLTGWLNCVEDPKFVPMPKPLAELPKAKAKYGKKGYKRNRKRA